jgi:histone-lysine N-methyltransferase SETD1
MLAYQSVDLTVHPAPLPSSCASKETRWEEHELVDLAQRMIVKELRVLLEKDIMDRVVGPDIRTLMAREKSRGEADSAAAGARSMERRGLKGLSFKKQIKKAVVEDVKEAEVEMETIDASAADEADEEEEDEEEEVVVEPPKKRRKKELMKNLTKKVLEDVESEDDDVTDLAGAVDVLRKRAASEDREEIENEHIRKKQKVEVRVEVATKAKKGVAKKKKPVKKILEEPVQDVVFPDSLDFDIPAVAKVRFSSGFDSSLSPPSSPEPKRPPRIVTPPPTPPPDPFNQNICEDDEDVYFLKVAMSGYKPPTPKEVTPSIPPASESVTAFRKHITGAARTEGFYKITHAEKAAYVAQYQTRATTIEVVIPVDEPQPQHVTSSRSNRANARRRAQGLEEINQVQRAVALSKGETAVNELNFKFNQLQTRKKHLRFARSPIHDWGLYAMEKISRGEMVIEYVGEVIRAQVADKREKAYERQGIGSSYLFRIDEDLVVDATKKGNLGCVFWACMIVF